MKLITMLKTAFESGDVEASTKAQVNLFTCVRETIETSLSSFQVEANFREARAALYEKRGDKNDFEETLKIVIEETADKFIHSFLNLGSLSFSKNLAFYYALLLMLKVEYEGASAINRNESTTFTRFTSAITLPVLKDYFEYYGEGAFVKVRLSARDKENYEFIGYFPKRYEQFPQEQLPYFLSKLLRLKLKRYSE